MKPSTPAPLDSWAIDKRQLMALSVFVLLFALVVGLLYLKDRYQEWHLRCEQATHRLDLAYELISREFERASSDVLFLAGQKNIRDFQREDEALRNVIEEELRNFVSHKLKYNQVRLLDHEGREMIRVDSNSIDVKVIPRENLQDKSDRYYVLQSQSLEPGEVFVSEFDLNQEFGEIEVPHNPVIRFVTPVVEPAHQKSELLVVNLLGSALLAELKSLSLPGDTFLVRPDGHFLLGSQPNEQWGWLLGHQETFGRKYPRSWAQLESADQACVLTPDGALAARRVSLGTRLGNHFPHHGSGRQKSEATQSPTDDQPSEIIIISHLPREQVFSVSNQLRERLMLLGGLMLVPLFFLTRYWAVATVRRRQQTERILASEKRLRELSSRLLQIQEEERRSISREIHDELGQQVTAINLDLKMAERKSSTQEFREHLDRAVQESEHLLTTLHDFATRVRPSLLDDLGLLDAIASHVQDFQQRTGIEVKTKIAQPPNPLPSNVADNVFRIIQESLTNVVKHANATHVRIDLEFTEVEGQRLLELTFSDDGIGTVTKTTDGIQERPRLGILGMQERVDLLDGEFEILSDENQGTTINVTVPFETWNP